MNKILPIKISLPRDLASGQYRVDFYLKGPRISVNGGHEAYSPSVFLPFMVSGAGDFPQANIVHSQTRFAGGQYQAGPLVDSNSQQSGYVTIQNNNRVKIFEGNLSVKSCIYGIASGLGCLESLTYKININPGQTQKIDISQSTKVEPDVYSVEYELHDVNGRLLSIYKNRFIVNGSMASLKYLSVDKMSYKKNEIVRINAAVTGPYAYNISKAGASKVTLKTELYSIGALFENRIFSQTQNFKTLLNNNDGQINASFTTRADIRSYKICGTVSVGGSIVESRCIMSNDAQTFYIPWPWSLAITLLSIVFVTCLLWVIGRKYNIGPKLPFLIIITSFVISSSIIFLSPVKNASAQLAIPHGPARIPNSTIGADCAYIEFYNDKNDDNRAQLSEKTNLFVGKDDGNYYVPKGTIAYLFRPPFDDPSMVNTYTVVSTINSSLVTSGPLTHTITGITPVGVATQCIGTASQTCTNGTSIIYNWPVYKMDISQGGIQSWDNTTTLSVNVDKGGLIAAIDQNTHTDSSLDSQTNISAIFPALTWADVPDLSTVVNTSDLDLLDSYVGSGAKTPTPYPAGQIFSNFKTRCEAANTGQANANPLRRSIQLASILSSLSDVTGPISSLASSLKSKLDTALKLVDRSKFIAAVAPLPPTVTVENGDRSVLLSWPAVSGVGYYMVCGDTDVDAAIIGDCNILSKSPYPKLGKLVRTTNFTDTGNYWSPQRTLVNGTTYYYTVVAVGISDSVSSPIFAIPIATPTGLTGSSTNAAVKINGWSAVTGATGYRLYGSRTNDFTKAQGTLLGSYTTIPAVLSPISIVATNGDILYYKVLAYNSGGNGQLSSQWIGYPFATPSNLTVTPGNGQITLSWTGGGGDINFNVYRGTTNSATIVPTDVLINSSPLSNTTTSVTDTGIDLSPSGLVNGTIYYYKVQAVNANSETSLSITKAAQPISIPDALSVVPVITGNPVVNITGWSSVTGATGYRLYRATSTPDFTKTQATLVGSYTTIPTTSNPIPDSNVIKGTTYYYKVLAYNSSGDGTLSNYISVTLPESPTLISVKPDDTLAYLTWDNLTWTPQNASVQRSWQSVAMSQDGSRQTAIVKGGYIYTSSDYGQTWVQSTTDATRQWQQVAMSSSGMYQVAVVYGGYIYTSSTYGQTWQQVTDTTVSNVTRSWHSVAVSSDGTKIMAAEYNGFIYSSSDYGGVWTSVRYKTATGVSPAVDLSIAKYWYSVAMSKDGSVRTAIDYFGQKIYSSIDSGASWAASAAPANYYMSVAISDDGSKQTAATAGSIIVSTNSGRNWSVGSTAVGSSVYAIAMSSDGLRQALATTGGLYTSSDYGKNWINRGPSKFFTGVAMSSSGAFQTVTANSGYIYSSSNPATGISGYNIYYSTSQAGPFTSPISTTTSTGIRATVNGTTATIYGLTNGGSGYYFKIAGIYGSTVGPQSETSRNLISTILPTAPANLAGNPGDGNVSITGWDAVSGVTGYKLYRGNSSDFTQSQGAQVGGNMTSIPTSPIVDMVSNGSTYYYKVLAYDANGNDGALSSALSLTPMLKPGAPGIPGTLSQNSAAYVTWTTPTSGGSAVGYYIYISNSQTDTYTQLQSSDPTVTITNFSATVSGLTNGSTYYFKIAAYNNGGTGPLSDSSAGVTPLAAPTNITGYTDSGHVYLTGWSSVTGAAGYRIYRSTTSNFIPSPSTLISNVLTIPSTGASAIDSGLLTLGIQYYFKIVAYPAIGGDGPASSQWNVTPIGSPNPTIVPTDGGFLLSWPAVSGATGFNIYRKTSTGVSTSDKLAGTNNTSFTDSGISGIYYYRVQAINATGTSAISVEVFGNTKPVAPVLLPITVADSRLTLNWSLSLGANGYYIYRVPYSYAATSTTNRISTLNMGTTSYVDTGSDLAGGKLQDETTYYYKVSAYNSSGESDVSSISGVPKFYCSVSSIDTSSAAQTILTISGEKYYVDLDGVRGWLWQNGYISGTTVSTPGPLPAGTTVVAQDVLQYKFTKSGIYNLSIHQSGGFKGTTYDSQYFSDRRLH